MQEEARPKMSRSDQVLNDERQNYNAEVTKYEAATSKEDHNYNEYSFEIASQSSEDFRFTLPIDQEVQISTRIYTSIDGVYGVVSNIEGEQPIYVYAYEDRDRLVAQASFYSINIFSFQGKANCSYLVRYVNHGSSRLARMSMAHIMLQAHIDTKLTVEDVADHATRVRAVKHQLSNKLIAHRERIVLEGENQKRLLLGIDHYYFYNIGEIVVLGIICVIQVESIRKLLISSSVV